MEHLPTSCLKVLKSFLRIDTLLSRFDSRVILRIVCKQICGRFDVSLDFIQSYNSKLRKEIVFQFKFLAR